MFTVHAKVPRRFVTEVEAKMFAQSYFERTGNIVAVTEIPARAKRQAFDIRFRCTLTGCDWTSRLFLHDASEAFDAMYRRLAFGQGTGQGKLRYSREFYRIVSCEVSPDQSRPIG